MSFAIKIVRVKMRDKEREEYFNSIDSGWDYLCNGKLYLRCPACKLRFTEGGNYPCGGYESMVCGAMSQREQKRWAGLT